MTLRTCLNGRLTAALLVVAAGLTALPATAEEAAPPTTPAQTGTPGPEPGSEEGTETENGDTAEGGAPTSDTPDVFVPTVEVSEDTSVPFPVDI